MHETDERRAGDFTASRRMVIRGAATALMLAAAPLAARRTAMTRRAYVGCRTTRERHARGDGLGVWACDGAGAWRQVQLVRELVNPSYLAFDRSGRYLYAVHGDGTEASAFAVDRRDGTLRLLNRASTGGRNPVHLMPDPTNRFMIVANHVVDSEHLSGIASLPIADDGRLGDPVDVVAFSGALGPFCKEQPFPKPHQVQFDPSGRFIAVPDKGCDRTVVFVLDAAGKFREVASAPAREGAGPRHIAFHPRGMTAYVVNELDSSVQACRFDPVEGTLSPFQVVSALADTVTGNSRAAEIAISPDGEWLYASNRGSDTIACFSIEPRSGRLTARRHVPCGGKTPRFFALSPEGGALFVANEDSDTIVRFPLAGGIPGEGAVVAQCGSPTCIVFA